MNFKQFTTNDSGTWDNIVRSFKTHDIYYLSGYIKALEINGDGHGVLIYYNDGKTKAINVVMKRKIDDIYSDFITPYGYGGFLIEGDSDIVLSQYRDFCLQNNIVSEFVRFHPILKNQDKDSILWGNTISLDTTSRELVLSNIKSKDRATFRKAINRGVTIRFTDTLELLDTFLEIYASTMDKDNADDYYYFSSKYYITLFEQLSGQVKVYYAEQNGTVIAMSLIFFCNNKAHYHLSCSTYEGLQCAATNLLLYTVANDCADMGYEYLHLGGGLGGKIDSLYKFKKAFNRGPDLNYYIGKKIYIPSVYQALCDQKNIVDDGGFFPAYRKI